MKSSDTLGRDDNHDEVNVYTGEGTDPFATLKQLRGKSGLPKTGSEQQGLDDLVNTTSETLHSPDVS